jgi:hypothetical protein
LRALDVVLGGRATGALQLDIETPREQSHPFPGQALGLRNIVLHERAADIACLRAGERKQPVGAPIAQPVLPDLGAAARLIFQPGPGEQLG